jgi:hypothetical protein
MRTTLDGWTHRRRSRNWWPKGPPNVEIARRNLAPLAATVVAALEMKFYDVAAVIVFLRQVIWTVPGFTVDRYRPQLAGLHRRIQADGSFTAHSQRFLIEGAQAGLTAA